MNLSAINAGMRVKNYKELCKLLGEPEKKGGTSKLAQLKRWARYFSWKREGNAYVITEVFEIPFPEPFQADDELAADFLAILHDHFRGCGEETFYISDLLALFGITNGVERQRRRLGESVRLEHPLVSNYDYHQIFGNYEYHVSVSLSQIVYGNLNKLAKREYLDWEKTLSIKPFNEEPRLATPRERDEYDQISKEIKEGLGINGYVPPRRKSEYRQKMSERLHTIGWSYAYPSITIAYNPKYKVADNPFDVEFSRRKINDKAVSLMTQYIETDTSNDIEYISSLFDKASEEDSWIIDYFYPLPIDKYLAIRKSSLNDMAACRKDLIDEYIRLP